MARGKNTSKRQTFNGAYNWKKVGTQSHKCNLDGGTKE